MFDVFNTATAEFPNLGSVRRIINSSIIHSIHHVKHPPIHPFIALCINPGITIYPSTNNYTIIHRTAQSYIHPSIPPSTIHLSIYTSINCSIIQPLITVSVIHHSIHPTNHPSIIYPSIIPVSIHPSIRLSMHPILALYCISVHLSSFQPHWLPLTAGGLNNHRLYVICRCEYVCEELATCPE